MSGFPKLPKGRQAGFSLVEVLLAVTIVSFLSVVLYSTLSQGGALWRRALTRDPMLMVDIAFEKIGTDMRNSFLYNAKPVRGADEVFEFFTVAPRTSRVGKGSYVRRTEPLLIRYEYDGTKKAIMRHVEDYGALLFQGKTKAEVEKENVLGSVNSLHFYFYDYNRTTKGGTWRTRWLKNCMPQAVKIILEYGEKKKVVFEKIIPVPANHCLEDE
jgi:prepilin-type N-terminal cleavage/methylation domain-containing protein